VQSPAWPGHLRRVRTHTARPGFAGVNRLRTSPCAWPPWVTWRLAPATQSATRSWGVAALSGARATHLCLGWRVGGNHGQPGKV